MKFVEISAKGTWRVQTHCGIQHFVPIRIGFNSPVIDDIEIRGIERFLGFGADKDEIHIGPPSIKCEGSLVVTPWNMLPSSTFIRAYKQITHSIGQPWTP